MSSEPSYREVRYRHSRDFCGIIEELGASLLVSTYQAGKLVTVGGHDSKLRIALHNFEQAMGMALHPARMAVGSRGVIWMLQNVSDLAPRLEPPGTFDALYLARSSIITGNIHAHEMAWIGDELWICNTLFSCLCTLDEQFSFVPRWRPPFISALEANDRCHLNGLAVADGRPRFVTVMARSDEPGGWRPTKASSGCILDVATGEAVSHELAMPHSPRVHESRLWVLNSGCGTLELVDPQSGQRQIVDRMPGYTRGLAFCGPYAFVGMSRIRETAVFGGVPIAEKREELKCAVAVVDLRVGRSVAFIEFESGVEEIFDVQVLPRTRLVSITGPYPSQDDAGDIWVVPPPEHVPRIVEARQRQTQSRAKEPLAGKEPDAASLVRLGLNLQREGKHARAVETLKQAIELRPKSPEIHNHLGNAWQDFGRQDLARQSYEQALAVQESFAPAHQNLGYLLINFGQLDEGRAHLARAQELQPADVNRVMLATALPVIYESEEDVARRREALVQGVDRLLADGVTIDTTSSLIPTNFFSAYQGYDDCHVQRQLGRIYRAPNYVPRQRKTRESGRLRVGFLSAHFRDHTIGRLNLGRIALLDRERFEVTVIAQGHHDDPMARQFRERADNYVDLPSQVEAARRRISELGLDVLLFADVGMNALTYTLAFSRMAEVQCVTWGHPVTTGSPAMDYFLSSQLLETDAADAHYTERLVRLANLGTYYYRPKAPATATREQFGLDVSRHIYLCPQTLFKMHPQFDPILREILSRDPLGELVLIEGRQPTWTRLLKERFARTMPEVASRVRFLAPQPNADFLALNQVADVLLDTIHFGGGNTSYEAFAMGTPIITLPGEFLRSRITLALYKKMGLLDCVAETPEQYVDLAVRLGADPEYRRATSARITAACPILFEDAEEVRELERALLRIAGERG